MKQLMILLYTLGGLLLVSHLKAQVVLEALDAPNGKCLERVYDKYYGDGVHNYIYCAVQGPNGKKWLNLNLGAEYAKESSPHFNPEAVPTDHNDWKAFGNLYQWGRDSDGHEQVEYRQGSAYWEFRPINGVRTTLVGAGETSNQTVSVFGSWTYSTAVGDTWLNDPCPSGYHIASATDLLRLGELNFIQGSYQGTSVFGNLSDYPDLKLMTSPVNDKAVINDWQGSISFIDTVQPIESGSALWLGTWEESYYYYYIRPKWYTGDMLFDWSRRGYLSRGVLWEVEEHNYSEYGMFNEFANKTRNIVGGIYPSSMAIRCVQN